MAKKLVKIAAGVGLFVAAAAVLFLSARGEVGEVEATPVPEFPSLDAKRWANGAPVSLASARGEVIFLEGWAPS